MIAWRRMSSTCSRSGAATRTTRMLSLLSVVSVDAMVGMLVLFAASVCLYDDMPNSSSMRAAVLTAIGQPFEVMEIELVPLAAHRVLVRTHASTFCATDVLNASGGLAKAPPTILGHASVGTVQAVADGVTKVRVGDRVIIP